MRNEIAAILGSPPGTRIVSGHNFQNVPTEVGGRVSCACGFTMERVKDGEGDYGCWKFIDGTGPDFCRGRP